MRGPLRRMGCRLVRRRTERKRCVTRAYPAAITVLYSPALDPCPSTLIGPGDDIHQIADARFAVAKQVQNSAPGTGTHGRLERESTSTSDAHTGLRDGREPLCRYLEVWCRIGRIRGRPGCHRWSACSTSVRDSIDAAIDPRLFLRDGTKLPPTTALDSAKRRVYPAWGLRGGFPEVRSFYPQVASEVYQQGHSNDFHKRSGHGSDLRPMRVVPPSDQGHTPRTAGPRVVGDLPRMLRGNPVRPAEDRRALEVASAVWLVSARAPRPLQLWWRSASGSWCWSWLL